MKTDVPAGVAGGLNGVAATPATVAAAATSAVSTAEGKICADGVTTLGDWLRLTGRDSALLQRKIPSLSREDRWRTVLSRRLDERRDGEDAHRGHVVDVLRGAQLGFTAEECRKVTMI